MSRDLIISGIPAFENGVLSTSDIVVDFTRDLGITQLSKNDLEMARRIVIREPHQSTSSSQRQAPPEKIHVKFKTEQIRNTVKQLIRTRKKESRTVLFHGKHVNFYAADFLTPSYNKLFYNAKDFCRENNFHSVWISNSRILFKKNKDAEPVVIYRSEDLQTLLA